MRYSETVHQEAYQLFLQGYACRQISETCHVPLPTIYLWQRRWREKLSGQTLKDLPLEDAGTLLLTTQALRRELEEAQRDLQILHESGILRTIPNMTVLMPADYWAARKLVRAAAQFDGPVYLRFTRDAIPVIYDENDTFEIGRAKRLKDGRDVAIIANGDTVRLALEAAQVLSQKGISARVLDMHTIKPLDTAAVAACISEIGKIITVEDHNILNGLGSAVADVVAESGNAVLRRVGIQDQFGMSAPYDRLLAMNGITTENIVNIAEKLVY